MEIPITLNMLFSRFLQQHPDLSLPVYPTERAKVSGVQLLPPDPGTCRAGYLYVCSSLHPALGHIDADSFFVLCVGDNFADIKGRNVILFCTEMDVTEVFNTLLNIYSYFSDWQRDLNFALLRNASLQDVVDISEDILDNPLLILDPSLKLLAYTKNHLADDDPAYTFAVQNGYLSPESVRLFEKDDTFAKIYSDAFLSSDPNEARAYSDMIQGIRLNDGSTLFIALLHKSHTGKSYVTELFKIFSAAVEAVFRNQKIDFHRERYVEDYFLIELLENRDLSPSAIRERLNYIKLPAEGSFLLCSIYSDLRQTSSEPYFINTLRNALLDCHIFSYDNAILVLFLLGETGETDPENYVRERFLPLEEILREHHAKICVSKLFFALGQIYAARQQTEHVFLLAQKETDDSLYKFFTDYTIPYLFQGHTSSDLLYDFCDPALLKMYQSGNPKAEYQMHILESFLQHGRKSTDTAQALNMHRNNVIYHITHMCEACGWDLEDAQVNLELMLSFSLLHYLNDVGGKSIIE